MKYLRAFIFTGYFVVVSNITEREREGNGNKRGRGKEGEFFPAEIIKISHFIINIYFCFL